MPDDKLQGFYNNLINSGRVTPAQIGDYNTFASLMQDTNKLPGFYANLTKNNLFTPAEIGDYNTFVKLAISHSQPQEEPFSYDSVLSDIDNKIAETSKLFDEAKRKDAQPEELSFRDRMRQNTQRYAGREMPLQFKIAEDIRPEDVNIDETEKIANQLSYLQSAKDMIKIAQSKDKVGTHEGVLYLAKGLISPLGRDFFTSGLGELARTTDFVRVSRKQASGQPLTDNEQTLIDAYNILQGELQEPGSISYKMGAAAAEMVPYLTQFALTRGAGTAAQSGVNKLLKITAKESIRDYVKGAGLRKGIGQVVKELPGLAAGAVTQSTIMPMTYTAIGNKLIGEQDQAGNFINQPGFSEATIKGFMANYPEVFTEVMGGHIMSSMGMAGRLLGKKSLGGLTKYLSPLQKVRKAAEFGGFLEETSEELLNNVLSPIFDKDVSAKDVWTIENVLTMMGSIALVGGGFYASDLAYKTLDESRLRGKYLSGLSKDVRTNVIGSLKSDKPEEISQRLTDIISKSGLQPQQAKGILDYAWAESMRKGMAASLFEQNKEIQARQIEKEMTNQIAPFVFKDGKSLFQVLDNEGNIFWVKDGQIDINQEDGTWSIGKQPLKVIPMDESKIERDSRGNIIPKLMASTDVNSVRHSNVTDKINEQIAQFKQQAEAEKTVTEAAEIVETEKAESALPDVKTGDFARFGERDIVINQVSGSSIDAQYTDTEEPVVIPPAEFSNIKKIDKPTTGQVAGQQPGQPATQADNSKTLTAKVGKNEVKVKFTPDVQDNTLFTSDNSFKQESDANRVIKSLSDRYSKLEFTAVDLNTDPFADNKYVIQVKPKQVEPLKPQTNEQVKQEIQQVPEEVQQEVGQTGQEELLKPQADVTPTVETPPVEPELVSQGNVPEAQQQALATQARPNTAEEWEKQNFTPEEIAQRRKYGLLPENEWEPTFRGASNAEWDYIKNGGVFQSEGLGHERVFVTPSRKLAESAGRFSTADVVIEFKPEARRKMVRGDDKFDSVEYYSKSLTLDDILRVTDKDGNVIYDSQAQPEAQLQSSYDKFTADLGLNEPFDQIEGDAKTGKIGDADIVVAKDGDKVVLESIRVPLKKREKGQANAAMKAITAKADELGMDITLRAVPEPSSDMSPQQLRDWYRKFGFSFVGNNGLRVANQDNQDSPDYVKPVTKSSESKPVRSQRTEPKSEQPVSETPQKGGEKESKTTEKPNVFEISEKEFQKEYKGVKDKSNIPVSYHRMIRDYFEGRKWDSAKQLSEDFMRNLDKVHPDALSYYIIGYDYALEITPEYIARDPLLLKIRDRLLNFKDEGLGYVREYLSKPVAKGDEIRPQTQTEKWPWEMTRDEFTEEWLRVSTSMIPWRSGKSHEKAKAEAPSIHKEHIQQALSEGKPVPPEVLEDYPELKPKETPQPVSVSNQPKKSQTPPDEFVGDAVGTKANKPEKAAKVPKPKVTNLDKKKRAVPKRIKDVMRDPESFEESVLQFLLSGGRFNADDFVRYSGFKKGSTEYRIVSLFGLKGKGTSFDVFGDSNPTFGEDEKGAMDMINRITEILLQHTSKWSITKRLEEMQNPQAPDYMIDPDWTPEDVDVESVSISTTFALTDDGDINTILEAYAGEDGVDWQRLSDEVENDPGTFTQFPYGLNSKQFDKLKKVVSDELKKQTGSGAQVSATPGESKGDNRTPGTQADATGAARQDNEKKEKREPGDRTGSEPINRPAVRGTSGGGRPGLTYATKDNIPEPTGFIKVGDYPLLDKDQVFAVNLAISRFKNNGKAFLLADGTGVGKTLEILATADQYAKQFGGKVLIITENQQIIDNNFARDAGNAGIDISKFELGTYHGLRSGNVGKGKYGLVIYDEAHNLKNAESGKRTAAENVDAEHEMYATATPMDTPAGSSYFIAKVTNLPVERVWEMMGFTVKKEFDQETQKYITRITLKEGTDANVIRRNITKIRNNMIEQGAMLRREYPFYGEFRSVNIPVTDQVRSEEEEIASYWDDMEDAARNDDGGINPKKLMLIRGQRSNEFSRWNEQNKAEYVLKQAIQDVKDGKKVVIIAEGINNTRIKGLNKEVPGIITEVVKGLEKAGLRVAKIYGNNNKSVENNKFQSNNVDVVVGTPLSAAVGIDLDDQIGDSPRVLYMVTPNYSGNLFQQILGRISRRNTKSPSEAVLLYNNTESDSRRRQIVDKKLGILTAIQNGVLDEDIDVDGRIDTDKVRNEKGNYHIKPISDKAFVVTGDTWNIKNQLKAAGGSWNQKYTGWTFPNSKLAAVKDIVNNAQAEQIPVQSDQEKKIEAINRKYDNEIFTLKKQLLPYSVRMQREIAVQKQFGKNDFAGDIFGKQLQDELRKVKEEYESHNQKINDKIKQLEKDRDAEIKLAEGQEDLRFQLQPEETIPTNTPEFKNWFRKSAVADDNGKPIVVYSGHSNVLLYGNKFDPKKATSGGFYASEDPKIASGYAESKWGVKEYYEHGSQYRIKGKNGEFNKKIWQIELTDAQKKKLDELLQLKDKYGEYVYSASEMRDWAKNMRNYEPLARRILYNPYSLQNIWEWNEQMGYNIAYNKPRTEANEPAYMLQTKNQTEEIMDALGIEWTSYDWLVPGIMPVYLSIQNPLDADKPFPEDLLKALKERAKGERKRSDDEIHYTQWTKDYPLKEFIRDIEDGREGWTTQVPKKALEVFKRFGYDGIKERGQKGSDVPREQRSINWIAFEPGQIKSATGNRGTFDYNNPDMRFQLQPSSDIFYSNSIKALESIKQEKATPEQWKAMLLNNGAKESELQWMGWDEFVQSKRSFTKTELNDWMNSQKVEVREVELGGEYNKEEFEKQRNRVEKLGYDVQVEEGMLPGQYELFIFDKDGVNVLDEDQERNELTTDEDAEQINRLVDVFRGSNAEMGKYSQYQLPGGSNYRELLLTTPTGKPNSETYNKLKELYAQRDELNKAIDDFNLKPDETDNRAQFKQMHIDLNKLHQDIANIEGNKTEKEKFRSSHFDQPNILAHVRFNERTDADGNRVLFIEEIQSDWAQKGKKEGFRATDNKSIAASLRKEKDNFYTKLSKHEDDQVEYGLSQFESGKIDRTQLNKILLANGYSEFDIKSAVEKNKVPPMPFPKTDQWVGLAMKRMIRYAADNGFDRIAWTTGEQQADRYDLRKQVKSIYWVKNNDGTFDVQAQLVTDRYVDGQTHTERNLDFSKIQDVFGKQVADKIKEDSEEYPELEEDSFDTDELEIGGEGMKAFYDNIIPNWVNKFGKKYGVKVGETIIFGKEYETDNFVPAQEEFTVPSFDLTDQLREAAQQGLPLFRIETNPILSKDAEFFGDMVTGKKYQDFLEFHANLQRMAQRVSEQTGTKIFVVKSAGELPAYLRGAVKRKNDQGNFAPALFFENKNGEQEVWIISNQTRSTSDAGKSLLHEVVAHHGLRQLFGQRYDDILRQVWKQMSDDDKIDRFRTYLAGNRDVFDRMSREDKLKLINNINESQRFLLADEWLAKQAETLGDKTPTWIQKIFSQIRQILRDVFGVNLKFTDNDLKAMFTASRKNLAKQAANKPVTGKFAGEVIFDKETLRHAMTLYHGTPHDFDKFSTSKIGTGEGAQAYGWGLYFTDLKEVAEWYANSLQNRLVNTLERNEIVKQITVNGKPILDVLKDYNNGNFVINSGALLNGGVGKMLTRATLYKKSTNIDEFFNGMSRYIDDMHGGETYENADPYIKRFIDELNYAYSIFEKAKKDIKLPQLPERTLITATIHKGKEPSEYDYLRWDKPVTEEQHQKILNQIKSENLDKLLLFFDTTKYRMLGEQVYDNLDNYLGSQQAASEFLLRAGIDGIKYPAESKGDNARGFNYVVFDENAIEIEDKLRFQIIGEQGAQRLVNAGLAVDSINNLSIAKEMETAGKTEKEIWLATGWQKGKDGKWRMEIPDFNLKVALNKDGKRNQVSDLKDVVDNNSYFVAYPKLKDVVVFLDINPANTLPGGSFVPAWVEANKYAVPDEIQVRASNIEQARSILSHEIQHAIQYEEGFAKGGNKRVVNEAEFKENKIKNLNNLILDLESRLPAIGERWIDDMHDPIVESVEKIKDRIRNLKNSDVSYEAYRALAGEVEARNAQTRLTFDDLKRAETMLSESEDVAREDQIVLMDRVKNALDLTPEVPQTETEAFKRWFGNSKVVDSEGKPLVVYHGSPDARFVNKDAIFRTPEQRYSGEIGMGSYFFTDSYRTAKTYADPKRAFDYQNAEEKVIQTYLSLQNPLIINANGAIWRQFEWNGLVGTRNIVEYAQQHNYDGLIVKNVKDQYNNNTASNHTSTVFTAFYPTQIKSATGNIGTFSPDNPDIRFSLQPPPPGLTEPYNPDELQPRDMFNTDNTFETKFNHAVENVFDSMLSVKFVEDEVERRGGKFNAHSRPYREENMARSRAQAEKEKFDQTLVLPFEKAQADIIQATKGTTNELTARDIWKYLVAKHAPERNRDLGGESGVAAGSIDGMKLTDEYAKWIVDQFENEVNKYDGDLLQKLWDARNKVTRFTLDKYLASGMISREVYDKLTDPVNGWRHYVPYRGWKDNLNDLFDYQSEGLSDAYNPMKKAEGRLSEADDPTVYMISMGHTAILAGAKNEYKRQMANLILLNPDIADQKDLFWFKRVYRILDDNGNIVDEMPQDQLPGLYIEKRDNGKITVVGSGVSGVRAKLKKAGGVWDFARRGYTFEPEREADLRMEFAIKPGTVSTKVTDIHQSRKPIYLAKQHEVDVWIRGERAIMVFADPKVAHALNRNNFYASSLTQDKYFQNIVGTPTRYLAQVLTSKNPAFWPVNMTRDIGYAWAWHAINSDQNAAEFLKNIPAAIKASHRYLKGHTEHLKQKNIGTLNEVDKMYLRWKEAGGETSYFRLLDIEKIRKNVDHDLKVMMGELSLAGKMNENVIQKAGEWLGIYSQLSENISRFATYMTAYQQYRKKGIEDEEAHKRAVADSKNVTVNFDKYGRVTPLLKAFYLFIGPNLGGVYNMGKLAAKNKTAFLKGIAAFMVMGLASAEITRLLSPPDDDDPTKREYDTLNDFIKGNYLVLPNPAWWFTDTANESFITIPMPQGFRAFFNMGVQASQVIHGQKTIGQALVSSSTGIADAFMPVSMNFTAVGEQGLEWKTAVRPVTPDLIKPVFDAFVWNEDFAGRMITREPFTQAMEQRLPEFTEANRYNNPYIVMASKWLNKLGGGDDLRSATFEIGDDGQIRYNGFNRPFDVNPARIEYLIEQYTGGVGTELNNTVKTLTSAVQKATGDEEAVIDSRNIPVLRRFYRTATNENAFRKWNELKKEVDHHFSYMASYKKNRQFDEYKELRSNTYMQAMKRLVDRVEKQAGRIEEVVDWKQQNEESAQKYFEQMEQMYRDALKQAQELKKQQQK